MVRQLPRVAVISALIGVGVTALIGVGNDEVYNPASFAGGAIVGLFIGLGASISGLVANRIGDTLTATLSLTLRMAAYFVGGVLGWVGGTAIASVLLGGSPWPSLGLPTLLVFGALAVAVGLVFDTVGRLRVRLEESIVELKEREFARKELETARAIQQRLLPPGELIGDGFRLDAINRAALIVAGDFYEYFRRGDGALGVALGDVSGKGMGASLIMASTQAVLPLLTSELPVDEGLEALNKKLLEDLAAREFVALILLRFDPSSGELELANAGLPDPYVLRTGGAPEILEAPDPRLPLGVRREVGYRCVRTILQPGDSLLLYTDGLPEGLDETGEPLGYERLTTEVNSAARRLMEGQDPGAWLAELVSRVDDGGANDDRTAVLLQRTK